jgi:hypothetical protein
MGLKEIMEDAERRSDAIVADFFVDAVKDMLIRKYSILWHTSPSIHLFKLKHLLTRPPEFKIPVAIVWPQMPFLMLGCSCIPGQPGFQVDLTLTSEHASIWSRTRNELVLVWAVPNLLKLFK